MKINYIGIIAGIIAFISLLFPWWVMSISFVDERTDVSVYPYQATAETYGIPMSAGLELWYGWAALVLIVITGIAGIVGSVIVGKTGKMILIVAGILGVLSITIFAAGLQGELSKAPTVSGYPEIGLFSSGSFRLVNGPGHLMVYSSYLTFGFWLALVATILALISPLKHPAAPLPASPPTLPTPES